jgi:aspartyl-tRNA(Asn)/glutamyl-tRNA(Gln) amidotransferase subunit C
MAKDYTYMSLDKATTQKVASLSHIRLKDGEDEKYTAELNGILQWIEMLSEVDTDGVEPLANVAHIDLKQRVDKVTDGGYQEDVLANAPESLQGYFVVPKLIE